jgi:sensor histidine kinase regulating citrate/malate metabolism
MAGDEWTGRPMKLRYDWTLSRRLVGAAVLLVVMTSTTVEMYFLHSTRIAMERRLQEKVDFINRFYVNSIADALSSQDDVRLLQDINRLEEDQEITSVVVVDQAGDIRYHSDPEKIGAHFDDALVEETLKSGEGSVNFMKNSGGKALVLASPFRIRGQAKPLGAVRMELTYRSIQRQLDITKRNYLVFLVGLLMFWIGAAPTVPGINARFSSPGQPCASVQLTS